jgi:hypothetical protein
MPRPVIDSRTTFSGELMSFFMFGGFRSYRDK